MYVWNLGLPVRERVLHYRIHIVERLPTIWPSKLRNKPKGDQLAYTFAGNFSENRQDSRLGQELSTHTVIRH